ncbi:uncharacterized protein C3F10.06c isoform X2 [Lotus japonicus]|uniref:uncharacterized protein C3F10.06c isoform X2 n=1 Tax=Lotus japonicus TaxID=34305 RepID=UPI00258BDA63|nr:uncharacterized protein C3F10.06c isoform X2 [Lotus japonicus]
MATPTTAPSTPLASTSTSLTLLKGGCMVVDSTRRGKRFPDSMSKTIPIWTCVLNRAIANFRRDFHGDSSSPELIQDSNGCEYDEPAKVARDVSSDWDCSLHLPLWVSGTEKASIEERLEEWTERLKASGADIATLAACLKKPLRPLWISQKTVIWLNEVPHHDSWDFTPVILVSASSTIGISQHRTTSEFSWNYIPGAGDDEESWARGLSPALFWNHVYDLINSGPDVCNHKVADIVEKSRVQRAYRGEIAPQIRVKSLNSAFLSQEEPSLVSDISNIKIYPESSDDFAMSWLGSSNLAVGTSQIAVDAADVDCILNCDCESITVSLPSAGAYLHLPMLTSKFDRFSLLNNLPKAVSFAKFNLGQGKRLLVCCNNGEDISVCVCLAILMSLFDEKGNFDDGKSFNLTQVTKWDIRRRLVYVCKFATNARPSRGNLRQVFNFLIGGKCIQHLDAARDE